MSIVCDLPEREYRRAPFPSYSGLKLYNTSPAHYKWALEHPKPPTPDMVFGTLVHHLALTPDAPLKVAVRPKGLDGRTKEGRAWLQSVRESGKEEITQDSYDLAVECAEALKSHPRFQEAIDSARFEVSVFSELEGVKVKGRLDILARDPIICDIKTCDDARAFRFERHAFDLQYFLQAGLYLAMTNAEAEAAGIEPREYFGIFAVEKNPPFGTLFYTLDEKAMEWSEREYKRILAIHRRCVENNNWPGYSTDIHTLSLPGFAKTTTP